MFFRRVERLIRFKEGPLRGVFILKSPPYGPGRARPPPVAVGLHVTAAAIVAWLRIGWQRCAVVVPRNLHVAHVSANIGANGSGGP